MHPEGQKALIAMARAGGRARAKKLTPERRREIARSGGKAAAARREAGSGIKINAQDLEEPNAREEVRDSMSGLRPAKVKCHGKCQRMKLPFFFHPSQFQRSRPVCMACRRAARVGLRIKQKRGAAWRESARRLFVNAIVHGRAA